MKNLVLIISFVALISVSGIAQPEVQLKDIRKMPKGITVEKLKAHVIQPEHIKNIEMEEVDTAREVSLRIPVNSKKFKAKPKLDVNKFGETIHSALKDNVTGYIMQVRQNGNLIYNNLWKDAQTPVDQNKNWSENTQMHVASVSKFLTAVGMVKVLDSKGISYDAKIIDYLPTYWSKGSNIDKITFRHLLTHTSGFGGESSESNYLFMKGKVALGVSGIGSYDYENMNFGLMRILIPIINGDIKRNHTFIPDSSLNNAMWDAITIAFYKEYMQDNVFTPAGVANPTFAPLPFVGNNALAYKFPSLNQNGWNSGNLASMAGGAAWRLTSKELLNVMDHFRRKNTIVPAQKAQYILDNNFGIDQKINTDAGTIYNKNGRWSGNGRSEQSVAYFFPNGMEVVVFVNSPIGTNNASLRNVVKDAFLGSLVE